MATPSGAGSAQDTVNILKSSRFKAVLDKVGDGALDRCTVDSVCPGETATRALHDGDTVVNHIVDPTVYLTANC